MNGWVQVLGILLGPVLTFLITRKYSNKIEKILVPIDEALEELWNRLHHNKPLVEELLGPANTWTFVVATSHPWYKAVGDETPHIHADNRAAIASFAPFFSTDISTRLALDRTATGLLHQANQIMVGSPVDNVVLRSKLGFRGPDDYLLQADSLILPLAQIANAEVVGWPEQYTIRFVNNKMARRPAWMVKIRSSATRFFKPYSERSSLIKNDCIVPEVRLKGDLKGYLLIDFMILARFPDPTFIPAFGTRPTLTMLTGFHGVGTRAIRDVLADTIALQRVRDAVRGNEYFMAVFIIPEIRHVESQSSTPLGVEPFCWAPIPENWGL